MSVATVNNLDLWHKKLNSILGWHFSKSRVKWLNFLMENRVESSI